MTSPQTPAAPLPIDSRPFEHTSSRGVTFNISRCDLDEALTITAPEGMPEQTIMLELCEMMTWHSFNIAPQLLNGRSAYVKEVVIKRI